MNIKEEAQEEGTKERVPVSAVSLTLEESTVHSDGYGIEICLDCAEKRNLSREWRTDPYEAYHYIFLTELDFSYRLPSYCNDCGVFLGGGANDYKSSNQRA